MTVSSYFSQSYGEAREKFRETAAAAGAGLAAHDHPVAGPAGEALHCDTAWFGPRDAAKVLVTVSATHGVEGFCGSGVQVGCIKEGIAAKLPDGVAHMAIHAINPYGFAWLRRVTEDNVDLNRNFVDFSAPLPRNPGYEELAQAICPETWDDASIAESADVMEAYAEREGGRALQSAISGGQYSHPDGIFFGGRAPTWSHRTLKRIFAEDLAGAEHIAVIDYHTGLGPRGYGERICVHAAGSAALERAGAWYDDDITSPAAGTSSSVVISGFNVMGMEAAAPQATVTAIALEYGTIPTRLVRLALRADNWLHCHGDPASDQGKAIKQQIREAFYQDADDWKRMIWERAVDSHARALAGLTAL
ncbi:MAG TPA: M14 family metallopeptidase [Kiloniellaceae bacterium]|nr:M14 family metallopeptidase [Kiloniellaceae bacterium]